ncbi:acyltransferase [Psychrobacillus sp. FJAT-51614]|uniref:Acyltransferase n=1 Tax=Psychrobacillus mangrovi TaxID=3117745 RepID=A0ABU8F6C1_9BACI
MLSNNRNENGFDFLRLFAAVCVVVQHAIAHLEASFFWLDTGESYWFWDGVPLFFILSGLLVYQSCEKCVSSGRPIWQYFANRLLRIAPAIYAYVLITITLLLVIGILSTKEIFSVSFFAWFLSNIFLVPVYHPIIYEGFGVGVVNGSLWTIPVEFGFYTFIPVLFFLETKYGFKKMIIFVVVVSLFGECIKWLLIINPLETLAEKLFLVTFIPHLLYFGIGIFWLRTWRSVKHSPVLAALAAWFYIVIRYDILQMKNFLGPFYEFAWALPLSYAVIWFGYNAPIFFLKVTKLGDYSYGIYIWHMVVINTLMTFQFTDKYPNLPGTIVHFIVLLFTLLMAMFSWWIIEKPTMKFKPFSSRDQEKKQNRVFRQVR